MMRLPGKKDIIQLLIIMILIPLVVTVITLIVVYHLTIKSKMDLLKEISSDQTELIMTAFQSTKDINAVLKTIEKQEDITNGLDETGEFILAYRKRDSIYFILEQRNEYFIQPKPISTDSKTAEPIKYALQKHSGFIRGRDYKNKRVLAYCNYIPSLEWGVVVKTDLAELQKPFYHAAFYAVISSILLVLIGIYIFRRVSLPIVKKIIESNERYRNLFEHSVIPIWEVDLSLIKKYLNVLRESGISDLEAHLEQNQDALNYMISLVKVIDINQKSVSFFKAGSKEDLLTNTQFYFSEGYKEAFREMVIRLAGGATHFEGEIEAKTVEGKRVLSIHLNVAPGYENSLGKILVSFVDFTDRKHMEEALKESEKQLRRQAELLEYAPVLVRDLHDQIIMWDRGMEELYGFRHNEALGTISHDLLKTVFPVSCTAIAEALNRDGYWFGELRHHRNDGRQVWVNSLQILHQDRQGEPDAIIEINNDITLLKKREAELHKLNRTLRALGNSRQAMLHATDEVPYLQEICRIIQEDCGHAMIWIGYAMDDDARSVIPIAYAGFEKGYLETLHITWQDTERGRGPTGTAIRTGQPAGCKNMLTDPDFTPWRNEAIKRGYASSVVLPLKNGKRSFGAISIYAREPESFSNEEVTLLSQLASDVSFGVMNIRLRIKNTTAEKAIRLSEEKYRQLFNKMTDGFALHEIILDDNKKPCDYKFVSVNPSFEAMTGRNADDIIGKTVREAFPETGPQWIKAYGSVALTGKSMDYEHHYPSLDKYFNLRIFSPQERFLAVIYDDITFYIKAQKAITASEQQLRQYAEELKELVATKDKFFGILAHDLRNPFSSLFVASELLYENVPNYDVERTREFIKILNDSAKHGYDILENLLEWSRTQTGTINYNPEPLNIAETVNINLSTIKTAAISKQISLYAEVPGEIQITSDRNMLNTILRNLLNNAIKFTPKGGQVSVHALKKDDHLLMTIKDTGTGISEEDMGKLFRVDVKFSNVGTEGEKGTGLGLILCKEFIEKLGGKIWVESVVNQGSEFKFTIPL
jgi:PAS domain S-box-containing protein